MALGMLLHSAHGATRSVLRRSPAAPSSARWCGLGAPGEAAALRSRQCRGTAHRRHRCTTVMKSTEKFFVGGNWKANGTRESVKKLVTDLNNASFPKEVEVVVAPVYIHLEHVISHIDSSRFQVSAQNCWVGKAGAFTGEVAPEQLLNMGIPWVILGHSERRSLLGESNEFVGEKVANALSHGLKVMACIGETLDQRQAGQMYGVLEAQLQGIADRVSDWENVVVAYEPVWAIGTGKVATPDQAQEVHAFIRKWFSENISPGSARRVRIIYGGSVNDKNAAELASQEDLDGFLVGGASLNAPAFATICSACERVPA